MHGFELIQDHDMEEDASMKAELSIQKKRTAALTKANIHMTE
jgi:hypothetical protein